MKKHLSTLSMLVVLLVMSCSSADKSISENKSGSESTWETVLESAYGGPDDPKIIVAKEPSITEEFFKEINSVSNNYKMPEVDYSKEMLFILCLGQRNTGGYAMEVTNIKENNSTITVTVKETTPEPGGMVTTALSNPFAIVKTKYSPKKVVFNKE